MTFETHSRTDLIVLEPKKFVPPIIEKKRQEHLNRRNTLQSLKEHFSSTGEGSTYQRELEEINHLINLDNL